MAQISLSVEELRFLHNGLTTSGIRPVTEETYPLFIEMSQNIIIKLERAGAATLEEQRD